LAALASPFTLEAKKKGGKKKKKKQQSAPPPPDLCAPQLEPCKAFFTRVCGGDDPRCQAAIACCSHLGTCDADGYWACLVIASNS